MCEVVWEGEVCAIHSKCVEWNRVNVCNALVLVSQSISACKVL